VEKVQGGTLVVVQKVARGSPAAQAGLLPGDLVLEVNSREISTVAEFDKAVAAARRSGQLVLLFRRGYAAERIAFDFD
jgi:S1-C subfamily serine protease